MTKQTVHQRHVESYEIPFYMVTHTDHMTNNRSNNPLLVNNTDW